MGRSDVIVDTAKGTGGGASIGSKASLAVLEALLKSIFLIFDVEYVPSSIHECRYAC